MILDSVVKYTEGYFWDLSKLSFEFRVCFIERVLRLVRILSMGVSYKNRHYLDFRESGVL